MADTATCPNCRRPLQALTKAGVTAFVCRSCRGVAFKGADLHTHFGDAASTISSAPSIYAPNAPKLPCPSGCGAMWQKRVVGPPPVQFDVCPLCHTTWFDQGEVAAIVTIARARVRERAPQLKSDPLAAAKEELMRHESRQATQTDDEATKQTVPWWLFALFTGLPVEGYNPLFRWPIVTWAMMVACVALFVTDLDHSRGIVAAWAYNPGEERFGLKLFTAMFLHADWAHLLGNLYFLKVFGDNVEDRLGRFTFLIFYLLCGAASAMFFAVATGFPYLHLIGASGAIAGVLGAYLVYYPDVRISVTGFFTLFRWLHVRSLWYLPFWFAWQFVAWKLFPGNTAWWAHIGGFVTGVVLALILRAKPDARLVALAKR